MASFNFDCPHCNRVQTVTEKDHDTGSIFFSISESALGKLGILGEAVCCANPDCRMPTVLVQVKRREYSSNGPYFVDEDPIVSMRLLPVSGAKPQPGYIPAALVEDYSEACKIKNLSPKASATLARRCIQGMIRDFAGVTGRTLFDEISSLKKLLEDDKAPRGVSIESIEAIDAIRSIGNIGAHMEKDIDLIVPVDADEAQRLIDLIESLFDEWYVERNIRQTRFADIRAIAAEKAALRLPKPQSNL